MSSQKRPAIRKRGVPAELLGLGGPSAGAGGPKPGGISADLLFTPEERAARERREFEEKIRKLLKESLVDRPDVETFDFEPMAKPLRNLIHEVAADLKLHSQSVEDAPDQKHVVVSRKPLQVELSEAEQKRQAKAHIAQSASRDRRPGISDVAPPASAVRAEELVSLNQHKRDRRTLEEVEKEIEERKKRKQQPAAAAGGAGGAGEEGQQAGSPPPPGPGGDE